MSSAAAKWAAQGCYLTRGQLAELIETWQSDHLFLGVVTRVCFAPVRDRRSLVFLATPPRSLPQYWRCVYDRALSKERYPLERVKERLRTVVDYVSMEDPL